MTTAINDNSRHHYKGLVPAVLATSGNTIPPFVPTKTALYRNYLAAPYPWLSWHSSLYHTDRTIPALQSEEGFHSFSALVLHFQISWVQ